MQNYARTWSLLQAYNEQSLIENLLKQPEMKSLVFDQVLQAIEQLK